MTVERVETSLFFFDVNFIVKMLFLVYYFFVDFSSSFFSYISDKKASKYSHKENGLLS